MEGLLQEDQIRYAALDDVLVEIADVVYVHELPPPDGFRIGSVHLGLFDILGHMGRIALLRILQDESAAVLPQTEVLYIAGGRDQNVVEDLQFIVQRVELDIVDVGDALQQLHGLLLVLLPCHDHGAVLGVVLFGDGHVCVHDLPHAVFYGLYGFGVSLVRQSDEYPHVEGVPDADPHFFAEHVMDRLDEYHHQAVLIYLPGLLIPQVEEFNMRIVGELMCECPVRVVQL